jgi:hypothetical protein
MVIFPFIVGEQHLFTAEEAPFRAWRDDDDGCLIAVLFSHNPDQGRRIAANASRYRQMRKANKNETTMANGRPLGSIKM